MSLSRSSSSAVAGAVAGDDVPGQQVAALRQAAVDYVERATGLSLDGSEESLAIVDHYLTSVRPGGANAVKPDVLRLIAGALGVYLGEILISRFGGGWRLTPSDDAAQQEMGALAGWRVELEAAPLRVDPIGMAAEALMFDAADGEEEVDADADENTAPGFTLLESARQLFTPLHAALARSAPVTAEYYYSLTGRFETLSYIVDLVTDLRHQEDARQAAASDAGRQTAAAPEPPEPQ